ncbi:acyl carrier protein [Reyranella sp.]|uniref:acyl carrier protein n=1 Tax=Reyranella sp. TaxID=1929291 RepID=UPI003BABC1E0
MTRQELVKRIEDVVASEIGAAEVRMDDGGTAADIGRWDSMAHVRIMLGIEEAFGISMDISTTYEFANFGALFDYVADRAARGK